MLIEQLLPVSMKQGGICLSVSHKKHWKVTQTGDLDGLDVGFIVSSIFIS